METLYAILAVVVLVLVGGKLLYHAWDAIIS